MIFGQFVSKFFLPKKCYKKNCEAKILNQWMRWSRFWTQLITWYYMIEIWICYTMTCFKFQFHKFINVTFLISCCASPSRCVTPWRKGRKWEKRRKVEKSAERWRNVTTKERFLSTCHLRCLIHTHRWHMERNLGFVAALLHFSPQYWNIEKNKEK